jgi:hypothetical protein
MAGITLHPGDGQVLMDSLSRNPANPFTVNSDDFWLPRSGGVIITIDVTDVSGGGSITALRVMNKSGSNYDKVIEFTGLAINAAGRYAFLIAPGATAASNWKGKAETLPPTEGRLQVVHTDANPLTYSVSLQCVKA